MLGISVKVSVFSVRSSVNVWTGSNGAKMIVWAEHFRSNFGKEVALSNRKYIRLDGI